MHIGLRVRKDWSDRKIPLVMPKDFETVARELSSAGLVVGRDFVEFLSIAGGMEDDAMGSDLWCAWNLEHLIVENRNMKRDGVYFADWLIHSHLHFCRLEPSGLTSVWADGLESIGVTKVASSVEVFYERYLLRDQTIGVYFEKNESKQP